MPASRPLLPEDYWDLCSIAEVRLSPDATRVAYTVVRPDRESDKERPEIWVSAVDGSGARAFSTNVASSPRWSPDGTMLAYVSKTDDGMQLVVAPLDGGEPRTLSTGKGNPREPAWSPDSTRIAFGRNVRSVERESAIDKNRPRITTGLRDRADAVGPLTERRSQLFVVDVATGDTTQITSGDWDSSAPAWSPDGSMIAFVSDRRRKRNDETARSDLYTVAATGGKATRRTDGRGSYVAPSFSPSGELLASYGTATGNHWLDDPQLATVSLASGEVTVLATALDRGFVGVPPNAAPTWLDDETLLALHADRGGHALTRVSSDPAAPTAPALDGDRLIPAHDVAGDGTLVWVDVWADRLPEVHTGALPASGRVRRTRQLSSVNSDAAAGIDLRPAVRTEHTTDDGFTIETFTLAGRGRGTRPGVLSIHGGPFGSWPSGWLRSITQNQVLASAGYTVLLPNPRGSIGYGQAFRHAVVGDMGGADYDDLMGAVDAAVDRKEVRDDEVHVTGYSYGGYMSTWMIGRSRRFRSAAIGAPPVDFVSMLASDVPEYAVAMFGSRPADDPDRYRAGSPITAAHRARTPTLIYCQEGDLRCPISQSEQLFATLKLHGCRAELARYPGGAHVLASPSQVVDIAQRVLDWFQANGR